jgi:hypothetical protein
MTHDDISSNTEWTPLLGDSLGHSDYGSFGCRVVDLSDVAMSTRGGGDLSNEEEENVDVSGGQ